MPHIAASRCRPLLAAGLLLAPVSLAGQQPVPTEATTWVTYGGDHALGAATSLAVDVHLRRADAFADWRQLMLRAGLVRDAGRRVKVAAGWAYLRTYEDIGVGSEAARWDHRAWQMVQLSHRAGPVAFVHRARLEERFLTGDQAAGIDGWEFQWRTRYQVRASAPLPAPLDAGRRLYVAASQELFAPFGPHEARPFALDQSRSNVAVGARVSPTLRVEVGYLNRAFIDGRRFDTRDHAIQVAIASTASLRAAARRGK